MNKLLVCLVIVFVAAGAMAQSKPFQASLTPEVAIYDRNQLIEGVTLNIWGCNPQKGLTLGFVNGSTGDSMGFSWALLYNYAESYQGVQWALVNYASKDFFGWQGALVNYTEGSMKGLQTGTVNVAGKLTGLQLGFFNWAEKADHGVQVGFINIIPENTKWFTGLPEELAPGMIAVNWRF